MESKSVSERMLKAVVVEPGKASVIKEIDGSLKGLQAVVGGYIETVYPFDDSVVVVCNDEGKIMGLPLNRALRDEEGKVYDIIAGTFAIVGIGEEDFVSLSDELAEKYAKMYANPELFARSGESIVAYPVKCKEQ